MNFLKWIIPSRNERELKKLWPLVRLINEIEAGLQKLSDDELRQKTTDWKARLSQIQDKAELAVEIMGFQGLGWDGDAFTENEKGAVKTMLRSKSATIAGGKFVLQAESA